MGLQKDLQVVTYIQNGLEGLQWFRIMIRKVNIR